MQLLRTHSYQLLIREDCFLTHKLSFGASYSIELDAELFSIGTKDTAAFTCKTVTHNNNPS